MARAFAWLFVSVQPALKDASAADCTGTHELLQCRGGRACTHGIVRYGRPNRPPANLWGQRLPVNPDKQLGMREKTWTTLVRVHKQDWHNDHYACTTRCTQVYISTTGRSGHQRRSETEPDFRLYRARSTQPAARSLGQCLQGLNARPHSPARACQHQPLAFHNTCITFKHPFPAEGGAHRSVYVHQRLRIAAYVGVCGRPAVVCTTATPAQPQLQPARSHRVPEFVHRA